MVCQQTVALDFVGIRAVFRCEQSANHDGAHICRLRDGQIVVGQIEWGPESAEGHWHPDVWVRGVASDEQADESTELRDRPRRCGGTNGLMRCDLLKGMRANIAT